MASTVYHEPHLRGASTGKMCTIGGILPWEPKSESEHEIEYQFYFRSMQIPILASRSGMVVRAKYKTTNFWHNFMDDWDSIHSTNYVVVDHGDGTCAKYVHINPDVRCGDKVSTGDPLGNLYGKSWYTDPHLHFYLFRLNEDKIIFMPVKFEAAKK